MTKAFKLDWQREVPEALRLGTSVDRWTEVSQFQISGFQRINDLKIE